MDLKTLLDTKPETLTKRQHDQLKQHVISRLHQITLLLSQEKYKEASELLFDSGDEYGMDNSCINFKWDDNGAAEPVDIGEVIGRLDELLKMANKPLR